MNSEKRRLDFSSITKVWGKSRWLQLTGHQSLGKGYRYLGPACISAIESFWVYSYETEWLVLEIGNKTYSTAMVPNHYSPSKNVWALLYIDSSDIDSINVIQINLEKSWIVLYEEKFW